MFKLSVGINTFLTRIENRSGLFLTSMIVALIVVGLDMLYVTPNFEPAYHGNYFADLSKAPFDFNQANPLRNRILPSLLGYLLGLRGNLFFILLLIFTLLFAGTLYFVYRKKNYTPVDALLFTGLIAFSAPFLIQIAGSGYTDIVFYYFIFLCFVFIRKPFRSAVFFALALLTHESSLFLFPGLVLYSYYLNKDSKMNVLESVLAYIAAAIPLIFFRIWLSKHAVVEYDLGFYFNGENIRFCLNKILPLLPLGAFFAFKLFWFFPIYALIKTLRKKEFIFFSVIAVIILCDVAQLIIAYDITRMLCLGFPVILLSAEKIKQEWDAKNFTTFLFCLTLLNFLVLQYFMSADGLVPLFPAILK